MRPSELPRSIAAARWFAAAVALMACNGHLDFGLVGHDAGSDGGGGAAGGGCGADVDCRTTNLHCDSAGDRTCVECVSDDHCSGDGGAAAGSSRGSRCDPKLRRCVTCLTSAQCPAAQSCVAGRCILTCVEDSSPPTCPAGSKCESGLCATCEPDEASACAATPATRYCLAGPQICVGCRTDADCGAGTRCDPVRKTCVACIAAADCPASKPLCDPTTGTCF